MKINKLRVMHILLAAIITVSVSPAYVYADELVMTEDNEEQSGVLTEIPTDEEADVITADEVTADDIKEPADDLTEVMSEDMEADGLSDAGEKGTITGIDAPAKSEYEFEYKTALVGLFRKLPSKIKVYYGSTGKNINVKWKCIDDYNQDLDEYTFVPDMKGYDIAGDVSLPHITVKFRGKMPVPPAGEIDHKIDLDGVTLRSENALSTRDHASLLKKYNTRKLFPEAENQNPHGTCWSFATMGALMGDMLVDGADPASVNYSELQLVYYSTHKYSDPKKCRTDSAVSSNEDPFTWMDIGGSITQGSNLLSNDIGAVAEKTVPYNSMDTFKGGSEYLTSKDIVHLKSAYYMDVNDLDSIKRAVIKHGSARCSYLHDDRYLDLVHNSYYASKPLGGGHAVTIVGWDDTFSKNNFNSLSGAKPEKDGAWLIRNSWGKNWGDNGYFWMSYYDAGLISKQLVVAFDAQKATKENVYAYDGQSDIDFSLRTGSKSITIKETYPVSGKEAITSVGFAVMTPDVKAKITVRNTKTGETSTGSITTTYAGFYRVKLKNELYIPSKTNVEYIIDYSSSNDIVLILEAKGKEVLKSGYDTGTVTVNGVCDKGFDYKFKSGSAYQHYDNDPRMKLYTVASKGPKKIPVKSVSLNKSSKSIVKGKKFTLKATVKPKNATNKNVTWKSSNKGVATVSSKGVVKGIKAGKATITVTTKDGKKKAKCKITVKKK